MKKIIVLTTIIVLSGLAAHADNIRCFFTEPFITVEYSTTTGALKKTDPFMKTETTVSNASFQIKGAGKFEVLSKDKKTLMTLDLNNKGSDGMSDTVYPYDAKLIDSNLYGGCESNFLKAKRQN